MKIDSIFLLCAGMMLTSCDYPPSPPSTSDNNISAMKAALADDQRRIEMLESQVKVMEVRSGFNYTMVNILTATGAEVSTTEPGYGICKINGGYALIQVSQAVSYLDGIKVTLQVGNPLYADLTNCTLTTYYGPDPIGNEAPEQWRRESKFVTTQLNGNLTAGRWTNEEVIIPGIIPANCRHLSVDLECKGMALLVPPVAPSTPVH